MKKAACSLLLLFSLAAGLRAQEGAEALISSGAAFLGAFFKDRVAIRVAVVRFENDSELSDLAMQKIYQMLISRLESEKNLRVSDLLVNFADGRGEFNLSQAGEMDFLLNLKLIQNKSRTGLGIAVFSRLQDRIVAMKYFEGILAPGERDWLATRDFAFSGLGFSKLLELESRTGLMDIQSIAAADGRQQYFFYYPDEIVVYLANETRLEKQSQFRLKWTRPFFPTLHAEGRLLLLRSAGELVLSAGNNFSPYAQMLAFRDGQWQEARKVDFVPFRLIELNQRPYLVGARFEEGRNYFKDKVYFLPFSGLDDKTGAYEKKTFPAMALDFSVEADGRLQSLHLIDRDYRYHLLTPDFVEMTPLAEKKGASLAALDGEWLAASDYSAASDQLFFYDIRAGGLKQVYAAKIAGEVQFIASGTWQNARGFWAGVRQKADGPERLLVQFWGKRNE